MRTKTKAERASLAWLEVEKALERAYLVAWDGCHKIYLAMDEVQGDRFARDYEVTFKDSPAEMLCTVQSWFDVSCGLRFVQSVATNLENPNAGYISLIGQGQL